MHVYICMCSTLTSIREKGSTVLPPWIPKFSTANSIKLLGPCCQLWAPEATSEDWGFINTYVFWVRVALCVNSTARQCVVVICVHTCTCCACMLVSINSRYGTLIARPALLLEMKELKRAHSYWSLKVTSMECSAVPSLLARILLCLLTLTPVSWCVDYITVLHFCTRHFLIVCKLWHASSHTDVQCMLLGLILILVHCNFLHMLQMYVHVCVNMITDMYMYTYTYTDVGIIDRQGCVSMEAQLFISYCVSHFDGESAFLSSCTSTSEVHVYACTVHVA